MLVKLSAKYSSDIYLERDGMNINAKSIIGVMTLAAEQGATLTLRISGNDEMSAQKEIIDFFQQGFGEL
jgi:phosphocarrier protein